MIDHIKGEPLSSTSALVLLWTDKNLYSTSVVKNYWSKLDLSAGEQLYEECNTIWPSYEAVINDRKWLIADWSNQILASQEMDQVIIFAAGWAPLGLELAERYPNYRIYELDTDFMEAKAKLVSTISNAPKNIRFVTSDISNHQQCMDSLQQDGWNPFKPTLLILEGISYYIKREDLMAVFDLAANQSKAILEYMVPYDHVEPSRRDIPIQVFGIIAKDCHLELPIETWDIEQIRQGVPGTILERVTLCDIEKLRSKGVKEDGAIFPTPASGWIEIANILIEKPQH